MKKWWIGTNSWYKFCSYDLEEAPWYIFLLLEINYIADDFFGAIFFHSKLWELWWIHVFNPIFQWCYDNKIKTTVVGRDWDIMIKEQPEHMQKAIAEAAESEKDREEDPNFDKAEYFANKEKFTK